MEANKGKHLTISDREYIQDALSAQYTLKEIAGRLAKDPTTISKEIAYLSKAIKPLVQVVQIERAAK